MPMLIRNKAAHVMSGGMLQLTSDLLMARPLVEGADVIYTLAPPVDNPKEGTYQIPLIWLKYLFDDSKSDFILY